MAINFFHTEFLFKDDEGFGIWRLEHANEHTKFVQVGMTASPVRLIPDYDLSSWSDASFAVRNWLTTHENVHELLRGWTGVSGINLADVDLSKEDEFYDWLDAHAAEHTQIRQVLGINT